MTQLRNNPSEISKRIQRKGRHVCYKCSLKFEHYEIFKNHKDIHLNIEEKRRKHRNNISEKKVLKDQIKEELKEPGDIKTEEIAPEDVKEEDNQYGGDSHRLVRMIYASICAFAMPIPQRKR
ncbi:uncharacterized protein LOC123312561 [Coccinella septempunctata]|uniref:uncharacterized protein LOC123312561 n=1 Tax=Coccinella septempunctata TaxID=41139 RepID=UPI001D0723CC|nr:uncharacterized protein LOC123312561 [Coccinella septempunctata]